MDNDLWQVKFDYQSKLLIVSATEKRQQSSVQKHKAIKINFNIHKYYKYSMVAPYIYLDFKLPFKISKVFLLVTLTPSHSACWDLLTTDNPHTPHPDLLHLLCHPPR